MDRFKKLVLLHSNDMHGDFLSENIDGKLIGGVSRLSGYLNMVRSTEPNTLYAIAGDMFRGSVIDSEFKGFSTIEIMNFLSPDVVTVGNHECDYGIAHLLFIEKCAKFPIINANFFIKTNHARLFRPYYIADVDGMKVLFIGIITKAALAQARQEELIGSFIDINEAAIEVGRICDAYNSLNVDLTVLLTHIGYNEDKALAAKLDPAWSVDVIIGGHSHTLLSEPTEINGTLIVQAGTGTDQIGRFDITVDTEINRIAEWKWETVPIDSEHCPVDPVLEKFIMSYKQRTDRKYGRFITRFTRQLLHPRRWQETELGNLFADIMCESLGLDIMLLGSGSIRQTKAGPVVLYSDLCEIFPYDDGVFMLPLRGEQLEHMLRHMLRDEAFKAHTEFYQLSRGMRVVFDREQDAFIEFSYFQAPIEPKKVYRVGMQKYHFLNMEKNLDMDCASVEENGPIRHISSSCIDILEEYLSCHQHLCRSVEGRIVRL